MAYCAEDGAKLTPLIFVTTAQSARRIGSTWTGVTVL